MKLRGIEFGHVLDASGVRGWFGEGYPFHKPGKPFGLSFRGSTFVAKTTTLHGRDPNHALRSDGLTPRVLTQRNVKIDWRKGIVLNSLGLPGPGFEALLRLGRWQQRRTPFFLSFTAVKDSLEESRKEVRAFVDILEAALPQFSAPLGLQANFSCPNVRLRDHSREFREHLDEYQRLGIPIMVKLSATTSPQAAVEIAKHAACDAICVSNSIPWGRLPDRIDWRALYGDESPLAPQGGGGLSGAPLLPIVADWVRDARRQGLTKPINAGGGHLETGGRRRASRGGSRFRLRGINRDVAGLEASEDDPSREPRFRGSAGTRGRAVRRLTKGLKTLVRYAAGTTSTQFTLRAA